MNKKNWKSNRFYALMGLLGGILYGIADDFLYINSHLDLMNPDPAWAEMPALRFLFSMVIAVIGSCFLYFGYLATWRMLKSAGNKLEKAMGLFGVMGIVATVCAHFLLGCINPLIYKGMLLAGCEEQYLIVSEFVNHYTELISLLAIIGVYVPHLASIICLLKGKLGISRWRFVQVMVILTVVAGIKAGAFAALKITGAVGSCESLLEGLLCLIPYWYWMRQNKLEEV